MRVRKAISEKNWKETMEQEARMARIKIRIGQKHRIF
jgi:hypothetical protein